VTDRPGTTTRFAIRTAVAADLAELQRVFREASLSNPGDVPGLLAHPEFLVLSGEGVAGGRTRVAQDGGVEDGGVEDGGEGGPLLGFVTVVDGPDGDPELEDLFVDPERRRRGVARELVLDAARTARAAGHRRMWVTGNQHALAFYRAAGFVEVGEAATALGPAPRLRQDLTAP
jgi:GNAT superfamily N-acetyltransferase